jgi:hypothetical protein
MVTKLPNGRNSPNLVTLFVKHASKWIMPTDLRSLSKQNSLDVVPVSVRYLDNQDSRLSMNTITREISDPIRQAPFTILKLDDQQLHL